MKNIKNRIAVSFFANIFRGGSTLFIGILLARFLGSEDYGQLIFLVSTSMAIKQLLDLGLSSAFFTFLSQEDRSVKFIAQFFTFFFGKYILCIFIIYLLLPSDWIAKIWLGNTQITIVIALATVALQSDFWPIASQLLESQRKTIVAQLLYVVIQSLHFCIIFGLHYFGFLNVVNYLLCIGLLWCFAGGVALFSYKPVAYARRNFNSNITIKNYINYCLPLAPVILISFTGEFLDRWMLQQWGGSSQQAYFAISSQIASMSLLFTASFIKIFWKEIAEACQKNNFKLAISLYIGGRKSLFYCSAFIAAISISWASEILSFLYGTEYTPATVPLILLMLYSIQQCLGQIDSAFLMASSKTSIGLGAHILLAPMGIFIAFVMMSKSTILGFNLGATGLGIKLLTTQFISVTVMGMLIQKNFNIRFTYLDQLQILLVLFFLGMIIKKLLLLILFPSQYLFAIGFSIYFLSVLLLAFIVPKLFALPSDWLRRLKSHFLVNFPA